MRETVNGLIFDSNFDSGNLGSVEAVPGADDEYLCVVRRDCEGTPYANDNSSWFYFEVSGGDPGRTVRLRVRSTNAQVKLFGFGMKPVLRKVAAGAQWQRVTRVTTSVTANGQHFDIMWTHVFEDSCPVQFAFTYPYPLTHLAACVAAWEETARQRKIVFERAVIGRSVDKREVEALKITSVGKDADKKIVLLSARVHPGETPASYMLHGLIDFLLQPEDSLASVLLENFVFRVVPVLNPDGVARGHYRTDNFGLNLNRMYEKPKVEKHPTIAAMKKLFLSLHATGRLVLYIDFHAHATKRGCFMYGNAFSGEAQVENLLFPKLLSVNSQFFDFKGCNFSQRNMKTKGKKDGLSKKGTGRVALHAESGLVRCYTLEANYNTGMPTEAEPCPAPYTTESFYEVGEAVAVSLLDLFSLHPNSALPSTPYGSTQGVRTFLCRALKAKTRGVCSAAATGAATSSTRAPLLGRKALTLPTISKEDRSPTHPRPLYPPRPAKQRAERGE